MNKNKLFPSFVFVLSVFVCVILFAQKTNATTDATDTTGLKWENAKQLTNTSQGAIRPSVAVSADGKRIIVAYMYKTGSAAQQADPYYQFSNDSGKNWTASPAPIRQQATDESRFVNVTIDANKNGHAVWTENNNELWYRAESNWGSGAGSENMIFGGPPATFIIESPKIEAYGNNLRLVWSETGASGNDILFSRKNINQNWTSSKNISNSGGESIAPDMAIDQAGVIHVVWQQQVAASEYVIQYSRSTNSGVDWSSPISISDRTSVTPKIFNQPTIYLQGSSIHVAFENRVAPENQNAFYATCKSNCTTLGSWTANKVSNQNYSVKDADPAYLKPQMVMTGSCPLIMFTSIIGNPSASNERIRMSSGCENWSKNPVNSSVQGVMGTNQRAVSPSAATANGWYVYLAFERKDGSATTDVSQIFVTRNIPGLYLPIILK